MSSEIEKRLAALESRMPLPSDTPPKPEGPSLAECNARAYAMIEEMQAERASALGIATDALKTAFEPTERQRRAAAKQRKPLVAPPTGK